LTPGATNPSGDLATNHDLSAASGPPSVSHCSFGLPGKLGWGCVCVGDRDGVSELLELLDQSSGASFGVAAGEVVASKFSVDLAGAEHVPGGADDGVFDGAERFFVAAAGA
jgi:hypothetical protein